jgi:signal transduction histidine kinase
VLKQSNTIDWLFLSVGAALLMIALFSIGALVRVIGLPIDRLNRAIQVMLAGDFDQSIAIHGPKELRHLAQSLELLRIHSKTVSDGSIDCSLP